MTSIDQSEAFRRQLAAWFEASQRRLPWRTHRSLYRTVVSEFMLQQTQVTTVLPYFERWMITLPDFPSLAAASEETVTKLWEGLGYYRRARNLHRLAQSVVEFATPPTSAAGWMELPGVGPYTAAAIASLAFGDPAACVDGNVVRILARLTGDDTRFSGASTAVRHFTPLAEQLLDRRNPGRHNEAMMELGATVCTRGSPRCGDCPVRLHCIAAQSGIAADLPRIERPSTVVREVDRAWILVGDRLLLHRIPDGAARMGGLYELPTLQQSGLTNADRRRAELIDTRQRSITRHRITERIYRPRKTSGTIAEPGDGVEWMPLDRLDQITLSGPHRRWVGALLRKLYSPG